MSKLEELYVIGYVASDKLEDSLDIEVYPISTLPTRTGDLSENLEEVTAMVDAEGGAINVVINKTDKLTCTWYNDGDSNLLSPPMVTKGEIVKVYRIAGQNIFRWKTMFNKPEYRKREKYLLFFSNKGEIVETAEEALDLGYFLLIDTINKKIQLHTADNDGELCTYDVQLDTKKGRLLIMDGRRNFIELASHKNGLSIFTNEYVDITTTYATINAKEKAEINTKYCLIKSDLCDINP